jgi:hypothetical protein
MHHRIRYLAFSWLEVSIILWGVSDSTHPLSLLCILRSQVKAYPATMKGKLGKLPKAVTTSGSETSVERHFFLSEERSAEVPVDVIFPSSSANNMHPPLRSR